MTIAVSVSLGGLRSSKKKLEREVPLEAGAHIADRAPRMADADLGDRLNRAIDALAAGYRSVFVLHDVEGYTHEEIASQMGKTVSFSKSQLARAHQRLRLWLGEEAFA